ncbi:DUF4442 domain-containing protein [Actinoplanes sp. CA-054009]
MDATELARELLDPIPAHRTAGLEVIGASDGVGAVACDPPPGLANVIGSLHSSGLTTLADAAGLAAIIAAVPSPDAFDGVVPLGAAASMRFLAPARGRLTAVCELEMETRQRLKAFYGGVEPRVRLTTTARITDEDGTIVATGSFDWSMRRRA